MSVDCKTPPPGKSPRDLFVAALEIADREERTRFLTRECGPDADLRRRVQELLEERERLGTFLNRPALEERPPDQASDGGPRAATSFSEAAGTRIGRYKLLQEIGEGGCGSVYMADQQEPVRRRVALKVIKAGMDTKAVIARFEAERQALALMDHPGIAKVLDAGTTETGRPFFVMELVRGVRITEFCDENRLTTRERLELFVRVCHAIQHAHQKGIIHRDIKPSNVLVTLHDGVPVPKVIDFGIAKATEQRLTDKTVFTAFDQFIGTPAYMSPEQAEMSGLDIDTRTDIYSLGVLLYELLTGKTPFDGRELVESGLEVMRRTIREKEPLPPASRLQTLPIADATDVVKHRQEQLPALVKSMRGDLDWIAMKALAKDRTRRYETADALAADIERYLHGQPVEARPPTRRYRLQKFVQRNKLLVGSGASLLTVLMLGVIVSSWQAVRATRAEHQQAYLLQLAQSASQREARERRQAEADRLTALREAYDSDMNLIRQALLANNHGRVIDLLNRHRPQSNPKLPGANQDFRQWEWRYFWSQVQSDAAFSLARQSNAVTALAISPDGALLASTDSRGLVKLWDIFRRREIAALRGERGGGGPWGARFAFSPTGHRLAVAFDEHPRRTVIKVVDTSTLEVLKETTVAAGIQTAIFSDDGRKLLLWASREGLMSWDLTANGPDSPDLQRGGREPARRLGPRFGPAFCRPVFSADGKLLAAPEGGQVRVLAIESGAERSIITGFEEGIGSLAFSPDGELLAVGPLFTEVETAIKLFSVSSGQEVGKLSGHASWVPGLTFSPDGKRLVSAGADQTVRIWDISERTEVTAFRGHFSEVNCVAVSPDGRTIVSGCKDGTLFGWDAARVDRKKGVEILPGQVNSIEIFPDSRAMLSVNRDGTVALWDLQRQQPSERISALGSNVERLVVSPDGARIYIGYRPGGMRIMDWKTRLFLTNVPPEAEQVIGTPLAAVDDGRNLITTGRGGEILLWNTGSWESRTLSTARGGPPFPRPRFGDLPFAVSPDQRRLAIWSPQTQIEVFNLGTGQTEARFNTGDWGSMGMAFSHDGKLLAAASTEGTVNLWDLATGQLSDALRGHLLSVNDVAFSPDGQRLASASTKNAEAVKLWDPISRHEVATLPGEGSLFRKVRFSPNGSLLLAINGQGKVHLWRAPSLQEIDGIENGSRPLATAPTQ